VSIASIDPNNTQQEVRATAAAAATAATV